MVKLLPSLHEASGFSPRREREGRVKEGRKGREKERGRETDQTTQNISCCSAGGALL